MPVHIYLNEGLRGGKWGSQAGRELLKLVGSVQMPLDNSSLQTIQLIEQMLHQKIRTEKSIILQPEDLQSSFHNRFNSFQFFKANSESPTSSSCIRSEQDSFTSEDYSRLHDHLHTEKERNESLMLEMSTIMNELHIGNTLANELEVEKSKLVKELRSMNAALQKVQDERVRLIEEKGALKSQLSCAETSLQLSEEQIYNLESDKRRLIDELNFERELACESSKENQVLKTELQCIIKNYTSSVKDLSIMLIDFQNAADLIHAKSSGLQAQIEGLREEVQGLQVKEKQTTLMKNEAFKLLESMKVQNICLKRKLDTYSEESENTWQIEAAKIKLKSLQIEEEYKTNMRQKENQIEALRVEVVALRKEKGSLEDQVEEMLKAKFPQFHTNTQYLNKMIKENFREHEESRCLAEVLDDQNLRLKEELLEAENKSKNYLCEIERLELLLKHNLSLMSQQHQISLEELQHENKRLGRRIEQLEEKQQSLKMEMTEKDRIILAYVQKQKSKN